MRFILALPEKGCIVLGMETNTHTTDNKMNSQRNELEDAADAIEASARRHLATLKRIEARGVGRGSLQALAARFDACYAAIAEATQLRSPANLTSADPLRPNDPGSDLDNWF